MKIPALLEQADREGIDFVSTGHYATVVRDDAGDRFRLRRAKSLPKDQSYVLYSIGQQRLARTLLPLGGMDKAAARAVVADAGLISESKAGDSQDICFVPDGDYAGFLARHSGAGCVPGDFVDEQGKILGRHRGIWHYTIGQRKGLGLSLSKPLFVKAIDAASGRITLSENDALLTHELLARDLLWLDRAPPEEPIRMAAKIRYAHQPAAATLYPTGDGGMRVVFEQAQRAVTPGQAVVFYDDEFVAGGGTIVG